MKNIPWLQIWSLTINSQCCRCDFNRTTVAAHTKPLRNSQTLWLMYIFLYEPRWGFLFVSFWFWFLFACLFLSKVSSGANKKMTSVGTTCVNKRKPHRWLPVWGKWVQWRKQHWPNPWDSTSWTQTAGPTEKHSLHHACLECPQQAPDSGQLSLYCLLLRATSVICQGELWRTRSLSLTIKWSLQRSWTQPLARLSGSSTSITAPCCIEAQSCPYHYLGRQWPPKSHWLRDHSNPMVLLSQEHCLIQRVTGVEAYPHQGPFLMRA